VTEFETIQVRQTLGRRSKFQASWFVIETVEEMWGILPRLLIYGWSSAGFLLRSRRHHSFEAKRVT